MNTLEYIKGRIKELYESGEPVHIELRATHSRLRSYCMPARITGVYKSIFGVETEENGQTEKRTYQYSDVLIGQIIIEELSASK